MIQIGSRPPPGHEDPVGMIVHCHQKMLVSLDALERAAASEPVGWDVIDEAVAWFTTGPGVRHTEDEDYSLYPRLAADDTQALLAELAIEHRAHEAMILSLRTAAAARQQDDAKLHATAFAAAMRAHIAREEAELLPKAAALDPKELRAIGIEMRLRRGG